MKRHTRTISTLFACGSLFVVASAGNACSSRNGFDEENPMFGDGGATPRAAACDTVKCSRDLKKVVSGCDDTVVVQECDPGLGCAEGACIPDACHSAELAKGSFGCSFYTLPPAERTNGSDQCFAAIIANTWDTPVNVTAEFDGKPLDITNSIYTAEKNADHTVHKKLGGALAPGAVAIVFLSQGPGSKPAGVCPAEVTPAFGQSPIPGVSGFGRAFRLTTDKPVSAYSIYPYGGAATMIPSATLLLPTSAWTTNYIAVDGWPGQSVPQNPFLQIVAQEDDTEVRMRPTVNIVEGDSLPAGAAGQTQTWKLSRGQVVQLTQFTSLAGSPIESNKPVGLFGGTQCVYIGGPDVGYCDTLHQQIPPLSQWGSEYAAVPYLSRLEGTSGGGGTDFAHETVPYRLVGAVDGTTLTYEPYAPLGAPSKLDAGEVFSFLTSDYFTVKSQDAAHPFYASVFMTGSMYYGTQVPGDPDFVNLVPTDQFLDRYIFSTDYTYSDTNLTLVRRVTSSGFQPVELDCAGQITGWQPLGSSGQYEYAFVRLTHSSTPETYGTSSCGYGRHEIKSGGPFGITVWGIDFCASYGYPGGMGLRPVNTVKVPVPVVK